MEKRLTGEHVENVRKIKNQLTDPVDKCYAQIFLDYADGIDIHEKYGYQNRDNFEFPPEVVFQALKNLMEITQE
jgi:hypothetical protein